MLLLNLLASSVLFLASIQHVKASALTTIIAPNERLCFYADVDKAGEKIGASGLVQLDVQAGGSFDIDFDIKDPNEKLLLDGQRERSGDYVLTANTVGEYAFCFENDMSTLTEKLLDLDIMVESEPRREVEAKPGQVSDHTSPIEESIYRLNSLLMNIKRTQRYFHTRETRGFSLVKSTQSRLFWYGVCESLAVVGMAACMFCKPSLPRRVVVIKYRLYRYVSLTFVNRTFTRNISSGSHLDKIMKRDFNSILPSPIAMPNVQTQTTTVPHTQEPYVTRTYPTEDELNDKLQCAALAQITWRQRPLKHRIEVGNKFVSLFKDLPDDDRKALHLELTMQMGRPVGQVPGEIRGFLSRAEHMLSIAEACLSDVSLQDTDLPGFKRYIKREPLGVVFVIAPWNYPYLVTINAVLPAIVAGNAVLLKPSPQTPLVAERFVDMLHKAGVPQDLVQVLHLSPSLTTYVVQHALVDFVSFTGSVVGGQAVERAAVEASGFKGVALELGGKDPAYVRPDADLQYAVAELVDGAMFNSGQSCCAIERIYVHDAVYDAFVTQYVDLVKQYTLGDPTKSETSLGPVVSIAGADRIRKQVADAVKAGATALIPEDLFPMARLGTAYVAPQVLINVDHTMDVMMEETFGPVVGIQKVTSDDDAIRLMNDSRYGLTASVWTNVQDHPESEQAFLRIVDELQTGTVFLNRCDVLDPALAWTGVKDSGRGVSLSKFGYDQLTRAKSVHMKIKTT
ncbi:Aldehyde/histidinol dehydrogenase [Chiua virens]|nr:Aldehyde/histidinol dehydrogenase [Chiua virens]